QRRAKDQSGAVGARRLDRFASAPGSRGVGQGSKMARSYGASARVLAAAVFGLAAMSGVAHAQFTNWNDLVKPGATVAVGGVAQEFTYNSGPRGGPPVATPP